MLGHTLAGTLQEPPRSPLGGPLPGVVGCELGEEPLSARQAPTACCWESHPANCTSPESEQVGCDDSMQRRYPSASAAQDGVIEDTAEQPVTQLVPLPEEHPACAIFAQVAEHEAETWAGEQLSPHVASGPASLSWLVSPEAPHPTAEPRATSIAPWEMHVLTGAPCGGCWPRSGACVNRSVSAGCRRARWQGIRPASRPCYEFQGCVDEKQRQRGLGRGAGRRAPPHHPGSRLSDARAFPAGAHAGPFIVRLPDSDQRRLGDYLVAWFSGPDASSWERCLVIATPRTSSGSSDRRAEGPHLAAAFHASIGGAPSSGALSGARRRGRSRCREMPSA